MLHDYCVENNIYCDFALVPFSYPASAYEPKARVDTVASWDRQGFGFLCHPVHSYGWYDYDSSHPHDASQIESSIVDCYKAFELYGIEAPRILVWPGNSYTFEDNLPIVKQYYDCAIISSYNKTNHLAENDRYNLSRLSFEGLKKGYFTKSEMKQIIKEAVDNGDWIIFASHFNDITINDEPDETSYSTANVLEILTYANSLCSIRHTADVWNERKALWSI